MTFSCGHFEINCRKNRGNADGIKVIDDIGTEIIAMQCLAGRGDAAKLENYCFSKKHFSSVVKGLKTVFSEVNSQS